jgi:hypothetical protein
MSQVQKAANLDTATKYRLSVHYPERLEQIEFSTFTEATGEFCRCQLRSVGADSAIIEQVSPNGDKSPVARWSR